MLQEKLLWNDDSSNFVQIVNISRNHWVCVSNIGCKPGTANSLPCYSMKSPTLSLQVAAILRSPTATIELSFTNIQRQIGGSDCGLFAIACATSICNGLDPSICSYDQSNMRDHLKVLFEMSSIGVFPPSSKTRRNNLSKVLTTWH